ncbi:cation:proton antiporter [Dermacoccus sp. Tok2021]|uniref:cation:proton antiporter n=1 Tax=Dermacoccus sp. Tok2021 TaxID=2826873 RepID=UPI001CA75881|nr:cation:proton antiporter [Dermacoccus sp. Tok2021]
MAVDMTWLLGGVALLLAVFLPTLVRSVPISTPLVLLGVGVLFGLMPLPEGFSLDPAMHNTFLVHAAEATVLVALMGVGLALDRPLRLRHGSSWRAWAATWRLLGVAMPLCIAAVALLGWGMGIAAPTALLLGAALAPTDPVLASDVQVAGPETQEMGVGDEEIDESDEVRFALTSEAGLNDGLAFPFIYAAIAWTMEGAPSHWALKWIGWDLIGKVAIGAAGGALVGWVLGKLFFRLPHKQYRLADAGEPLAALAAIMTAYGLTEVAGGYGFLAVFVCGLVLRASERGHSYHADMHSFIERLEQILTLLMLLLLGASATNGLLAHADWRSVVIALVLIFLIRPASGWISLAGRRDDTDRAVGLTSQERWVTAFFGVRGIGTVFYVAYATGKASFDGAEWLWSTVAVVMIASVVVHGIAVTPAMNWLERHRTNHRRALADA